MYAFIPLTPSVITSNLPAVYFLKITNLTLPISNFSFVRHICQRLTISINLYVASISILTQFSLLYNLIALHDHVLN